MVWLPGRGGPAAHLITSNYPLWRLWQVNQPGQQGDETVDLASGGDRLLINRPGVTVEIHPLLQGEFILLQALSQDETLSIACDQAMDADPAFDLGSCLQRYIHNGTLVAFHVPATGASH